MSGVSAQGVPEVQAAIRQIAQAIGSGGALGAAVQTATETLRQGTAGRAHIDTGTFAGAQTMEYANLLGRVFTGDARNPISGQAASSYAPYEEARGGSHAAYQQTVAQDGEQAIHAALGVLIAALP